MNMRGSENSWLLRALPNPEGRSPVLPLGSEGARSRRNDVGKSHKKHRGFGEEGRETGREPLHFERWQEERQFEGPWGLGFPYVVET